VRPILAIAALTLLAPVSAAQAPAAPAFRGLTLDAALAYARRENPDLALAASSLDSARAERSIAGAFPNPILTATPNTPYQYGATLDLDIGPQRTSRTRAAGLGVSAAGLDARDSERQVAVAVARAFYDALLADTLAFVMRERRAVLRQVLAADSARLRAGDIAVQGIYRSQGELARAEADEARAEVAARAALLALQSVIGLPDPDTTFAISGDLNFAPLAEDADSVLVALAMSRRPDLAATGERVAQSHAQGSYASALVVPIPQVSYVRQFTGPFESGRYFSFGVAIEAPVLNTYSGQQERATAGLRAAEAVRRRSVTRVRAEVIAAAADFRTERALVRRFEGGLVAMSDSAADGARYAYGRGAISLLEVLDAVRAQQDVRVDYFTALHDYWVSGFVLRAAVGADVLATSIR